MIRAGATVAARLRGDFAPLPAGMVYLDHAATAPVPEPVVAAILAHELSGRANVGRSLHPLAERAERAFEGARARIAGHLGCDAAEVVFTGGATQAINMVALGLEDGIAPGDEIVLTAAEHHSNILPWQRLARRRGAVIKLLPTTSEGRLDLAALPTLLGSRCRVVALTHASNVSGAVSDISAVTAAAHNVGALVLVDGAQAMAHLPVRPLALGADFYVFSGHKCFGPTGIGVLCGRRAALERLDPALVGGGMMLDWLDASPRWRALPHGLEAGTPPIASAVGLAAALDWLNHAERPLLLERETALTEAALATLTAIPALRLLGPRDSVERLPLLSFTVDGCHPHDVLHVLSARGLCLRGGHLCAIPMLAAFGVETCLRASLSFLNDDADVDVLAAGLRHAQKVLS